MQAPGGLLFCILLVIFLRLCIMWLMMRYCTCLFYPVIRCNRMYFLPASNFAGSSLSHIQSSAMSFIYSKNYWHKSQLDAPAVQLGCLGRGPEGDSARLLVIPATSRNLMYFVFPALPSSSHYILY
ncbi:hypothetical protein BDZ91DRAFT_763100 [Kalaharituber pfeilii]|nr:hypothetical protein BDZ91DRAFT_763100 [Kalaharituber pfeilii]